MVNSYGLENINPWRMLESQYSVATDLRSSSGLFDTNMPHGLEVGCRAAASDCYP